MADFLTMVTSLVAAAMAWFTEVAAMIVETPLLVFGLGLMVLGMTLRMVYSAVRRGRG